LWAGRDLLEIAHKSLARRDRDLDRLALLRPRHLRRPLDRMRAIPFVPRSIALKVCVATLSSGLIHLALALMECGPLFMLSDLALMRFG